MFGRRHREPDLLVQNAARATPERGVGSVVLVDDTRFESVADACLEGGLTTTDVGSPVAGVHPADGTPGPACPTTDLAAYRSNVPTPGPSG